MTTTHASRETQVLVVGAGPTGLTLAAELLARGIRTRIIDKAAGPLPQSRALGIHARTLEALDVMGLAERFIERGHRVRRFRMYAGGRSLLNLDMSRNGSRYGFILHLPQCETESLLRARVRELGGDIERGAELVSLDRERDAVHATIRDRAGRDSVVSAGHVVGCDGAHSRVRHELGLAFEGQPYPQDWLLADVAVDGLDRDDELRGFLRPDGLPLICLPMGGRRWRLTMPNAGDRGGRPPSLEEIQELVDERAPRRFTVGDPAWLACFHAHLRSTRTYRRGRVLLAGDAAHIHSPAGGQGMNTGMMDAVNLAWKLALVAAGRAPDLLLDTYAAERVPAASSVLAFTDTLVRLSTMKNPVQRVLRDMLLPAVTGLPAMQGRMARRLSQTSVACPPSPGARRRGPAPGRRVADVMVRTGGVETRLYAVLGRGRHVLLISDGNIRTAMAAAGTDRLGDLVDVVEGTLCGRSGSVALVRPDGILAVRGSGKDIGRVASYLRQVGSGRQPTVTASASPAPLLRPAPPRRAWLRASGIR